MRGKVTPAGVATAELRKSVAGASSRSGDEPCDAGRGGGQTMTQALARGMRSPRDSGFHRPLTCGAVLVLSPPSAAGATPASAQRKRAREPTRGPVREACATATTATALGPERLCPPGSTVPSDDRFEVLNAAASVSVRGPWHHATGEFGLAQRCRRWRSPDPVEHASPTRHRTGLESCARTLFVGLSQQLAPALGPSGGAPCSWFDALRKPRRASNQLL